MHPDPTILSTLGFAAIAATVVTISIDRWLQGEVGPTDRRTRSQGRHVDYVPADDERDDER